LPWCLSFLPLGEVKRPFVARASRSKGSATGRRGRLALTAHDLLVLKVLPGNTAVMKPIRTLIVALIATVTVISGAGLCVGPMTKFPSASAGGTEPSGNSFA
jgi:hypothetical protein